MAHSAKENDDLDDLTIYEELDEGPSKLEISLDKSIDDDLWICEEPAANLLEICPDDELEIYKNNDWKHRFGFNPGFSLELPHGKMTMRGGFSKGVVILKNADACASISWIRDPGIEPRILMADLVGKTCNRFDPQAAFSQIMAGENPAVIADVHFRENYPFAGAKFAAWISKRSDRIFIASVKYPRDGYHRISRIFQSMINGFSDTAIISQLAPRSSLMDCWAASLRDLLCSYAYANSGSPIRKEVRIGIRISSRGDAQDFNEHGVELSSFVSSELLNRASLVESILHDKGYHVKIMQQSGNIWPLVCDPSGNWQSVSLNPAEPWRMIGALVNGQGNFDKWYVGVCYDEYASLAVDNDVDISAIETGVKRLCEPSQILHLLPPRNGNAQWIQDLDGLLRRYSYRNRYYQRRIFSCANTSQILWAFLTDNGYDSRLMCSFDDHPMPRHMWVMTRPVNENDFVAIEATISNWRGELLSLGGVAFEEKYYTGIMYNSSMHYSILYPEQGMHLNPKDGITHIAKRIMIQ